MDLRDFDMTHLVEYPYQGVFYKTEVVDEEASLLDQQSEEVAVLETACDIQQASILGNAGFKTTTYDVYFPLPKLPYEHPYHGIGAILLEDGGLLIAERSAEDGPKIEIRRGMYFRSVVYGYQVDGVVEGVGFSQIAGGCCVAQIKDRTE